MCTCPAKLTFNPYTGCDHGCVYCYASSYVRKFSDCRPKRDVVQRLKREARGLTGQLLSISNSSDPYPNVEAEAGLTRKCLEVLSEQDCRVQMVTKSPLVLRDIDLLKKIPSIVSMTITTDDDGIAGLVEPAAPPPSARLRAVAALLKKDMAVSVRVDPVIPFVNDDSDGLMKTLGSIGVRHVTCSTFKVRPDSWRRLSAKLPSVAEKLKPLYFGEGERKAGYLYLCEALRFNLMKKAGMLAQKYGIKFGTCREGFSKLNTAACDGSWILRKELS